MPNTTSTPPAQSPATEPEQQPLQQRTLNLIGYILGISYPLLALSTIARGAYQWCCRDDITNKLGPALSLVAGILYLVAAIGFFSRRPGAWRLSVAALTIETVGVLVIGTISIANPDLVSHTAWSYFGRDYGFFPLIQPILGLAWLLWKPTRQAYGILPPAHTA